MIWLWLLGGFLLFIGLIALAHTLDRHAAGRYGYRPLALPNLAFMLIPHGILAAWAAGYAPTPVLGWALGALGAWALIFMLAILTRRTSAWVALAAAGLMTIAAPVLLLSMVFRAAAEGPPGE
jgi:hypothetical protein